MQTIAQRPYLLRGCSPRHRLVYTHASPDASSSQVPDMEKRRMMNRVLLAGCSLPLAQMTWTYFDMVYPPQSGSRSMALAKDITGKDITEKEWLARHPPRDKSLVQGFNGDPTYLIVNQEGNGLENYGLNAICTHLGCVVPEISSAARRDHAQLLCRAGAHRGTGAG